jgi:hypothetical protein
MLWEAIPTLNNSKRRYIAGKKRNFIETHKIMAT